MDVIENKELHVNAKQMQGGATQPLLVLLRIKKGVAIMRVNLNSFYIGLAVLLLLACMVGTSFAEPSWNSNSSELKQSKMIVDVPEDNLIMYKSSTMSDNGTLKSPKGEIVRSLFSGKGFAMKGNETLVLRVRVDLVRDVDPMYLRELIVSNKSIKEIEEKLSAKEGTATLRGILSLNRAIYPLINVKFVPSKDNATVLDADVADHHLKPSPDKLVEPAPSDKNTIAGHIKVTIAPSEGTLMGKGELIMSSSEYGGKYTVLLNADEPRQMDIQPEPKLDTISPEPGPDIILLKSRLDITQLAVM